MKGDAMNPTPTAPSPVAALDEAQQNTNGQEVEPFDPACAPKLDHLITQDDTPLDNWLVERLERLLTEPLYSSWGGPGEGRTFIAAANVGLFAEPKNPAFVPDFLLSLDVKFGEGDFSAKENHSYYVWKYGKFPDLILEVVSDRRGGEDGYKMRAYARMGVPFYVIYDPDDLLGGGVLRAFGIHRKQYEPIDPTWMPDVRLGLKFWEGEFQGMRRAWLRWCDEQGNVIKTGAERADDERRRSDDTIKRLQAQIRALGGEPEL